MKQESGRPAGVTFYTISNSAYFPGLVALINSLAITAHDYPIVIGDCGLTDEQRAILSACQRCRLVRLDAGMVQSPLQYKPFAHVAGAEGVVVVIDADMIVTGDLNPMISRARSGQLCVYPNPIDDRWFAEWQHIFGLSAEPRRQTYICSGLVVFSTEHWPALLGEWWNACRAIASDPTYQEGADWDHPTAQADQDALNAVLMTKYPSDRITIESADGHVARSDFHLVKIANRRMLDCRFRGRRPEILHAVLTPKPWQPDGLTRNVYDLFLRRLLSEPDNYIKVPPEMLHPLLMAGWRGWLDRQVCFSNNMGIKRLLVSYSPMAVRLPAKRTWTAVKRLTRRAGARATASG